MLIIPLQAVPNQTVNVVLNNQSCVINIYQKFWGMFLDLYVNGSLVIGGVICLTGHLCVISAYLGFVGDLMWADTQSGLPTDPVFTGVGTRYQLQYLSPSDVSALNLPFSIGVS
jgi:hypothetical protein